MTRQVVSIKFPNWYEATWVKYALHFLPFAGDSGYSKTPAPFSKYAQ
jgi:hypothetical protein